MILLISMGLGYHNGLILNPLYPYHNEQTRIGTFVLILSDDLFLYYSILWYNILYHGTEYDKAF